jgi:hypothetical protein
MTSPHGRVSWVALALALCAAAPSIARADSATDAATAKELSKPPERRSGLVFGFGLGAGVAGASGYPNAESKIGNPTYYDGSDAMGGGGGTVFVMGALSDWLNVGVFYTRANFRSADWTTYGGGGGFRVDLFPLYPWVPKLRDLAVYGQFGIGTSTLTPTSGNREAATGTESFIGGGVFYDFLLGHVGKGHFAAGPTLEYDVELTQANVRYGGLVGGRIAFYTGK